jgi:RNA polymerase sigma-70 factor, ECF subfamily
MSQVIDSLCVPETLGIASDEQLLLRYRDSDDAEAFETLVHRYEKPIYNYLLRYLHNASLAEEVFQATFFRLHQKRKLFSENGHFRPWLYSIATHLAIDALRTEHRHKAISLDAMHATGDEDAAAFIELLKSASPSPPEQLEARERAQWIRKAVANLPDHLRVIVLLVYSQGLRFQEAAEVLQLPLGTVKSRIHKALLALNSAWQQSQSDTENCQSP